MSVINEQLLISAEKILINYSNKQPWHLSKKEIHQRIVDWYEHTELVDPYDLAAIASFSKYDSNISYNTMQEIIENNKSNIKAKEKKQLKAKERKHQLLKIIFRCFIIIHIGLNLILFTFGVGLIIKNYIGLFLANLFNINILAGYTIGGSLYLINLLLILIGICIYEEYF